MINLTHLCKSVCAKKTSARKHRRSRPRRRTLGGEILESRQLLSGEGASAVLQQVCLPDFSQELLIKQRAESGLLSNVRGQAEPSHRIQNAEHQQSIIQVYTHDLTLSGGISIDVDLNPTPQPTPEPEPAPAPTPGPQNPPIFIGITGGGVPVTNPVPSSSPTYFNTADVIFLPKVPSSAKT